MNYQAFAEDHLAAVDYQQGDWLAEDDTAEVAAGIREFVDSGEADAPGVVWGGITYMPAPDVITDLPAFIGSNYLAPDEAKTATFTKKRYWACHPGARLPYPRED